MGPLRSPAVCCRGLFSIWTLPWLLTGLIEAAPVTPPGLPFRVGALDVVGIAFEPIAQGRNVVDLRLRNRSDNEQTFALHIQTQSPDYGRGVGWGQPRFTTIPARKATTARFVFKIHGPITDRTSVRLRFYNPPSRDAYEYDAAIAQLIYPSNQLPKPQKQGVPARPAPEADRQAVLAAFREFQRMLDKADYQAAWDAMTPDYRQVEYYRFDHFKNAMNGQMPAAGYGWEPDECAALIPGQVRRTDRGLQLEAAAGRQTWCIDFVKQDDRWRIDWIAGYMPTAVRWADWRARLLPTLEKRRTDRFDVYYFMNSTAARNIDKIAETRERGYRRICESLGLNSHERICLVLFEDEQTKLRHTGHQGSGMASGAMIAEVYNRKVQLDPYHETVHVLMRHQGNPPALLNEGLAVYMSERLGAAPLKHLSGGSMTVYQRARGLRSQGQWIPLVELLTYTEIGSSKSRPPVAYAEAGAFVKFLIETRGKDRFLRAYQTLQNSSNETVHQRNVERLSGIYGLPLEELERRWLAAVSK
ncbi:MAG: hypothetical protein JXQ73_18050 [Phycisphaerae bacterium]|nr:hypothetical protein [Phycisphaerae bacterium]